jgi:serine/threonine protein kinase
MASESAKHYVRNREMAGTLLKGRYRHLAEIGRGEHTVAYKALDVSLDRTVLVRVLREQYAEDAGFVERFQRVARAMAALTHPNLVGIHDVGTDRDLVFVVTEYVDGPSLEALLTSEGPLETERALAIAVPLCDALGTVHQAGYIHGQLTPHDVLLTLDGQPKVSDFRVEDVLSTESLAGPERSAYAALYLSPEQSMGRRATPASDVYSVGIILYEMLLGRPPFVGEGYAEIAEQHIRRDPEPLHNANPQIPLPLSSVVHSALSRASTDRYRSASELADALRAYQSSSARTLLVDHTEAAGPWQPSTADQLETPTPAYPTAAPREAAPARQDRSQGLDWVGCLMAMVAVVAVLGLIPLWLAVFLRYFV